MVDLRTNIRVSNAIGSRSDSAIRRLADERVALRDRRWSTAGCVMSSEQPSRLAGVLDDHLAAEFTTRDVNATMATMTADPYLNQV
jgi:hypothetical protein